MMLRQHPRIVEGFQVSWRVAVLVENMRLHRSVKRHILTWLEGWQRDYFFISINAWRELFLGRRYLCLLWEETHACRLRNTEFEQFLLIVIIKGEFQKLFFDHCKSF